MRISCIGGGPAGLYFAILMKKADPGHHVTVYERNAPDVTFGWGVVFSDETLGNLMAADPQTHERITASFAHWDAIDIHFRGQVIRSTGHGFSGISRRRLLEILQDRARELGVELVFGREVESDEEFAGSDLIFAADGVRSKVRERHAAVFRPTVEPGQARYIWLGTTLPLDAFTFLFARNAHGWLQVHAYRFDEKLSTFIVETDLETWDRSGFARMTTAETLAELERIFAPWLDGHRLLENRSAWIQFPTVSNERWHDGNVVLAGDAAHTAHFSIGSGTKLAMEDAIALARAVAAHGDVKAALEAYDSERRPQVVRLQRAARSSRQWFENVRRYVELPPLQFAISLLTRSLRLGYSNLRLRDPALVERATAWFAGVRPGAPAPPPMFTPLRLRALEVPNRVVVSPMCMYSAEDGMPGEFHLVHLGQLALGGAGLVMAEMTNVTRDGRITHGCTGLYRDEHVAGWRRIVDFVHRETRSRIGIQLGHAGRKGSCCLPWVRDGAPLGPDETPWPLIAPSALPWAPGHPVPREMDRADMDACIAAYVAAARRADAAGFDLVELHMAHGYLLASFLSPLTNRRRDAFGGSLTARMRFPLEVFEAVRAAWPAEKPMSVRISATDWVEGGFEPADAVIVARALSERGLDILHVSAGQTVPEQQPLYGRMFQTGFSDQVRQEAGIPTIAVGAISTFDEVNSILLAGRADLVALARQHLVDPHFTLRAAAEQGFELPGWPRPYLAARSAIRPLVRPPSA